MFLEPGEADADEPERPRPVGERAVEHRTGELGDPVGVVGAPRQAANLERREERGRPTRKDDDEPAGLSAVAGDLGHDLRGRDAERAGQARRAAHGGLDSLGNGARLVEVAGDLAEVEVALVQARALDCRNDLADGVPDLLRVHRVRLVTRADEDGVRAAAERLGAAHGGVDPEATGGVVRSGDDAAAVRVAADDEWLRAELGVLELLHGGEERVEIEVREDHRARSYGWGQTPSRKARDFLTNRRRSVHGTAGASGRTCRFSGQSGKTVVAGPDPSEAALRPEALDQPRGAVAPVAEAVVEAAVAVLPELPQLGDEAVAAPVRREPGGPAPQLPPRSANPP